MQDLERIRVLSCFPVALEDFSHNDSQFILSATYVLHNIGSEIEINCKKNQTK